MLTAPGSLAPAFCARSQIDECHAEVRNITQRILTSANISAEEPRPRISQAGSVASSASGPAASAGTPSRPAAPMVPRPPMPAAQPRMPAGAQPFAAAGSNGGYVAPVDETADDDLFR